MTTEEASEAEQLAGKLYQAVLSLKTADLKPARPVHRMAQALALAEVMAARAQEQEPTR